MVVTSLLDNMVRIAARTQSRTDMVSKRGLLPVPALEELAVWMEDEARGVSSYSLNAKEHDGTQDEIMYQKDSTDLNSSLTP